MIKYLSSGGCFISLKACVDNYGKMNVSDKLMVQKCWETGVNNSALKGLKLCNQQRLGVESDKLVAVVTQMPLSDR
jgi:hypothetical protein